MGELTDSVEDEMKTRKEEWDILWKLHKDRKLTHIQKLSHKKIHFKPYLVPWAPLEMNVDATDAWCRMMIARHCGDLALQLLCECGKALKEERYLKLAQQKEAGFLTDEEFEA